MQKHHKVYQQTQSIMLATKSLKIFKEAQQKSHTQKAKAKRIVQKEDQHSIYLICNIVSLSQANTAMSTRENLLVANKTENIAIYFRCFESLMLLIEIEILFRFV